MPGEVKRAPPRMVTAPMPGPLDLTKQSDLFGPEAEQEQPLPPSTLERWELIQAAWRIPAVRAIVEGVGDYITGTLAAAPEYVPLANREEITEGGDS